jgi:hypothetical protein
MRLADARDLPSLTEVWFNTTKQDPTTDFRYLESWKNEHADLFWKLARSKCAGYLNKCDFVVVYEMPHPTARHDKFKPEMKIVAMACWSFMLPTGPAYSSGARRKGTRNDLFPLLPHLPIFSASMLYHQGERVSKPSRMAR